MTNPFHWFLTTTNWAAASAIATAVMAWLTYRTLLQNRKQLDQMKQQWIEENRPIIEISLVNPPNSLDTTNLYFEILNIGKSVAKNISLIFDESIKDIPVKSIYDNAIRIKSKTYSLLPKKSILVPFITYSYNWDMELLIFGQTVPSELYKEMREYLDKIKINVKCRYEGTTEYTKECAFSYYDRNRPNMTTEDLLSLISVDLLRIKEEFQKHNNNNKNNG